MNAGFTVSGFGFRFVRGLFLISFYFDILMFLLDYSV